jgi:hypothetical protein
LIQSAFILTNCESHCESKVSFFSSRRLKTQSTSTHHILSWKRRKKM